jgi:N-acetylmuramoyl-L-alanine amidase
MVIREKTDTIVIHCAATKPSMDIGKDEIRKWHVDDNGWEDIVYHFIIRRNGTVEEGRKIDYQGAHAPAVNSRSIGICLIGGLSEDNKPENNFTLEQFLSLSNVVDLMQSKYEIKSIVGHGDVQENKKNCPGFNVAQWLHKENIYVG